MSTGIDQELKAAFEMASEFVHPDAELAEFVRAGARRRTLVITKAAAAGSVALLVAVGVGYAALSLHRTAAATHHHRGPMPRTLVTVNYQATQLGARGRYLYLLSDANQTLAAYDDASGKLIGQVTAPSGPSALAIGPGGLVWFSFYPQPSGRGGTWLLSPDLQSARPTGRYSIRFCRLAARPLWHRPSRASSSCGCHHPASEAGPVSIWKPEPASARHSTPLQVSGPDCWTTG